MGASVRPGREKWRRAQFRGQVVSESPTNTLLGGEGEVFNLGSAGGIFYSEYTDD